MCQENKEEDDSLALTIASMPRYNDLKTTWKSAEEDLLQQLDAMQTTQYSTEQKLRKNKNEKKNNYMDISRAKQAK